MYTNNSEADKCPSESAEETIPEIQYTQSRIFSPLVSATNVYFSDEFTESTASVSATPRERKFENTFEAAHSTFSHEDESTWISDMSASRASTKHSKLVDTEATSKAVQLNTKNDGIMLAENEKNFCRTIQRDVTFAEPTMFNRTITNNKLLTGASQCITRNSRSTGKCLHAPAAERELAPLPTFSLIPSKLEQENLGTIVRCSSMPRLDVITSPCMVSQIESKQMLHTVDPALVCTAQLRGASARLQQTPPPRLVYKSRRVNSQSVMTQEFERKICSPKERSFDHYSQECQANANDTKHVSNYETNHKIISIRANDLEITRATEKFSKLNSDSLPHYGVISEYPKALSTKREYESIVKGRSEELSVQMDDIHSKKLCDFDGQHARQPSTAGDFCQGDNLYPSKSNDDRDKLNSWIAHRSFSPPSTGCCWYKPRCDGCFQFYRPECVGISLINIYKCDSSAIKIEQNSQGNRQNDSPTFSMTMERNEITNSLVIEDECCAIANIPPTKKRSFSNTEDRNTPHKKLSNLQCFNGSMVPLHQGIMDTAKVCFEQSLGRRSAPPTITFSAECEGGNAKEKEIPIPEGLASVTDYFQPPMKRPTQRDCIINRTSSEMLCKHRLSAVNNVVYTENEYRSKFKTENLQLDNTLDPTMCSRYESLEFYRQRADSLKMQPCGQNPEQKISYEMQKMSRCNHYMEQTRPNNANWFLPQMQPITSTPQSRAPRSPLMRTMSRSMPSLGPDRSYKYEICTNDVRLVNQKLTSPECLFKPRPPVLVCVPPNQTNEQSRPPACKCDCTSKMMSPQLMECRSAREQKSLRVCVPDPRLLERRRPCSPRELQLACQSEFQSLRSAPYGESSLCTPKSTYKDDFRNPWLQLQPILGLQTCPRPRTSSRCSSPLRFWDECAKEISKSKFCELLDANSRSLSTCSKETMRGYRPVLMPIERPRSAEPNLLRDQHPPNQLPKLTSRTGLLPFFKSSKMDSRSSSMPRSRQFGPRSGSSLSDLSYHAKDGKSKHQGPIRPVSDGESLFRKSSKKHSPKYSVSNVKPDSITRKSQSNETNSRMLHVPRRNTEGLERTRSREHSESILGFLTQTPRPMLRGTRSRSQKDTQSDAKHESDTDNQGPRSGSSVSDQSYRMKDEFRKPEVSRVSSRRSKPGVRRMRKPEEAALYDEFHSAAGTLTMMTGEENMDAAELMDFESRESLQVTQPARHKAHRTDVRQSRSENPRSVSYKSNRSGAYNETFTEQQDTESAPISKNRGTMMRAINEKQVIPQSGEQVHINAKNPCEVGQPCCPCPPHSPTPMFQGPCSHHCGSYGPTTVIRITTRPVCCAARCSMCSMHGYADHTVDGNEHHSGWPDGQTIEYTVPPTCSKAGCTHASNPPHELRTYGSHGQENSEWYAENDRPSAVRPKSKTGESIKGRHTSNEGRQSQQRTSNSGRSANPNQSSQYSRKQSGRTTPTKHTNDRDQSTHSRPSSPGRGYKDLGSNRNNYKYSVILFEEKQARVNHKSNSEKNEPRAGKKRSNSSRGSVDKTLIETKENQTKESLDACAKRGYMEQ